jgi:hypothetical protein
MEPQEAFRLAEEAGLTVERSTNPQDRARWLVRRERRIVHRAWDLRSVGIFVKTWAAHVH